MKLFEILYHNLIFFFFFCVCRVHSLGFLFSAGVSEGLSRKDEIFNKLLDLFEEKSLYFRNPSSEGQYIAQVCAYDFNFSQI